jgi:hypothetical protein
MDTMMAKLVISKAVNQNVIVRGISRGMKGAVEGEAEEEFVIDVSKLQRAVVAKDIKFAKDAKIEEVMKQLKEGGKYKTPMMAYELRNVRAVSAAA